MDTPLLSPSSKSTGSSGSGDGYSSRREVKDPSAAVLTIQDEQLESGSGHNNARGSNSTQNMQEDVNGQGNKWWRPLCPVYSPMTDKATSLFLSKVTDTAVMGLVTLATFNATYLLAWGKPGTTCIPDANSSKSWQQILVAIVPFVVFPVTLYWSGVAKIAETDKHALSFVAGTCLFEFFVAVALGAWMSYCMAGVSGTAAIFVAFCLIVVMCVKWSLTFKYPKILSFHRDEDADATDRWVAGATLPSYFANVSQSPPVQS